MLESKSAILQTAQGISLAWPQSQLPDLTALELPDLESRFRDLGIEPFHARQVFRWVHRRGVTDPDADDRPRPRASRAARGRVHRHRSPASPLAMSRPTAPQKFLLELADGRRIESVFIPDTPAMTFCISSQVGCAMDCGFCLTGKMGFVRNLTPGEIVAQVRVLASTLDLLEARFNIVLMGMGEPLHNYDNVMTALRILCDEHGLGDEPAADHAVDRRSGAGDRPARARAADAESGHLAARDDRRAAQRDRADQPQVPAARI